MVIFAVCACFLKPAPYEVREFGGVICFLILSVVIGRVSRSAKLSDFENQRILQIERNIDTITGLPNRRSLFDALYTAKESGRNQAAGVPVTAVARPAVDDDSPVVPSEFSPGLHPVPSSRIALAIAYGPNTFFIRLHRLLTFNPILTEFKKKNFF